MLKFVATGFLALSVFAFTSVAGAAPFEHMLAKKGQAVQQCKNKADIKFDNCLWKHPLCKAGYKDECKEQCGYDRDDAYAECKKKKG